MTTPQARVRPVSKDEFKVLEDKVYHLHGIVDRLIQQLTKVYNMEELRDIHESKESLAEELAMLTEFIDQDPTGLY